MKGFIAANWRNLAKGTGTGHLARLATGLLIPFSVPYAAIQLFRAWLYRAGVLTTKRLPCPVVSIGNLTVGGTGKTPATALIADILMKKGYKVAVISRGYGGSLEGRCAIVSDGRRLLLEASDCGDEPFLLAKNLPGLMVVIGSDRHAAGLLALEQLKPDLVMLDDGFQHIKLHRDLNILLLDHNRPLGNGWTLPAGLLREPSNAIGRADFIIETRCASGVSLSTTAHGIPSCCSSHELVDLISLDGASPLNFQEIKGTSVVGFAGIAEPEFFFSALAGRGVTLKKTIILPDHAAYDEATLEKLSTEIISNKADWAVTTEKDGVKLRNLRPRIKQKILLARMKLTLHNPAPLNALLHNFLQK